MCEHGFGIVWMSQEVGSEQQFISEFKDRLICTFKQNWHSDFESKDKYSWFFSFKHVFQVETFLSVIKDKWHRINMTRFRLRTLGLNANKRWFLTETSTQAPCPMCGSLTENETHFLFHCKAYDVIREKCTFFRSEFGKKNDVIATLVSENENVIRSVAMFIAEAHKIRQEKIQNELRTTQ